MCNINADFQTFFPSQNPFVFEVFQILTKKSIGKIVNDKDHLRIFNTKSKQSDYVGMLNSTRKNFNFCKKLFFSRVRVLVTYIRRIAFYNYSVLSL
ncbi:hypothetical protein HanIR_Chr11g0559741 [Helianthus annuus]|nr:hypothetical protein HanIR_Chr11g0559741 [Helianthus annuus]